mmetsp:Transcript_13836/g.37132  ORF Transcript_13836/g.37132 Transcript_13836/m.37132 type:complete len:217 (-) Transcript_13836:35-685(-)
MRTSRNDRRRRHDALHSLPEPDDEQLIAVVLAASGANNYRVQILQQAQKSSLALCSGDTDPSARSPALVSEHNSDVDTERTEFMCVLPKKLRNVVWIRPGSFVIVQRYDEPPPQKSGNVASAFTGCNDPERMLSTSAVQGEIVHSLLPHQVAHLAADTRWGTLLRGVLNGQHGKDSESQADAVARQDSCSSADSLPRNFNRHAQELTDEYDSDSGN